MEHCPHWCSIGSFTRPQAQAIQQVDEWILIDLTRVMWSKVIQTMASSGLSVKSHTSGIAYKRVYTMHEQVWQHNLRGMYSTSMVMVHRKVHP